MKEGPTNASDRALLRRVLDHRIEPGQTEAFSEMAEQFDARPSLTLSTKQRAFVRAIIREHEPDYENAWSKGEVPRGADVPTPPALQNLPKRPPHRRHEVE